MNFVLIKNACQVLTIAGPHRARTGPEMSELGVLKDEIGRASCRERVYVLV